MSIRKPKIQRHPHTQNLPLYKDTSHLDHPVHSIKITCEKMKHVLKFYAHVLSLKLYLRQIQKTVGNLGYMLL